jgi:hypothetical protein
MNDGTPAARFDERVFARISAERQDRLTGAGCSTSTVVESPAGVPTRIIRTPAEVFAAASRIPNTRPAWAGEEGPVWNVTIMPGGVQLGSKDYARIARTAEARIARALKDGPVMALDAGQGKRGAVLTLSDKAVSRMTRTYAAIDYSPIAGDGCTPALVTLTMPHDWETVAPTPTAFRAIVNRFRGRYQSAWGRHMPGIWKLEYQFRQACYAKGCHDPRAPHLHILTSVPDGVAQRPLRPSEAAHVRACRRDVCEHPAHEQVPFRQWLSHAWALAVNHPDPVEFEKHLAAGTNVSVEDTLRYADAKRISVYFTKHGTFDNKAYQNDVPELWRRAIQDEHAAGANFWGYWIVRPVRAIKQIDPSLIINIARHLRKVHGTQNYVRPFSVWRLNTATGEYRRRRVRRRVKYMKGHRGFLSVNDGVAAAESIAVIVGYYAGLADYFSRPPTVMVPRAPRESREDYRDRVWT